MKHANPNNIKKQVEWLKEVGKVTLSIVNVLKVGRKPSQELGQFTYLAPRWKDEWKEKVAKALSDHIIEGLQPEVNNTFLQHVVQMPKSSMREQVELLSSISNYHWWNFTPVLGHGSKRKQREGKPKVHQGAHLLFSPKQKENREGDTYHHIIPTSPRNRLMYFSYISQDNPSLKKTIDRLVAADKNLENVLHLPPIDEAEEEFPARKKRKVGTRILKVDRSHLQGVDALQHLHYKQRSKTLFASFKEQLVTDGVIQWRQHDDQEEVVCLSDYDNCTGHMIPSSYVHVVVTQSEEGKQLVTCNCKTYNLLQKAALHHFTLRPGEVAVMDDKSTCMHCRFFKEHLAEIHQKIGDRADLSILEEKVLESLDALNDEVVLLGNIVLQGATKFSIRGEDDFSVVSITFRQNICFARCLNGICSAQLGNKKKIPKVTSLLQHSSVCPHMTTLFKNLEQVKSLFPEHFMEEEEPEQEEQERQDQQEEEAANEEQDEEPMVNPQEDIPNLEDAHLKLSKEKVVFDVNTGLWTYPAWSKHIPFQSDDPDLHRLVRL